MTAKTTNNRCTKTMISKQKFTPPTEAEVAICAYAIFSQENPQRALELWREAEAQLRAVRQHDAGSFTAPVIYQRN